MTTILGSIGVSQLADPTDSTKALAINFASAGANTTSTMVLPTAGQTFTLPNATATLVGESSSQTLTNKTINASQNTITNITNSSIDAAAAIDGSKITGNIAGNAVNVTGTVLIANGGTSGTSAADARSNLSAAQSGANADITSLSQTTTVALRGTTNPVNLQAQAATASWALQFPLNAGSALQAMLTNGSGVSSWGLPPPRLGGVALVDQTNGNDSAASVGGLPYLTITAALAAASSGQLVYVLPGTYAETITIPSGVCVRGVSANVVTILRSAVTSNTTAVTMGASSELENITITITSATVSLTLKGIEFPSTTATDATIKNINLYVSNTNTGAGTIYGIHSSGTGTCPLERDNIQNSVINVSSAVTTRVVGIMNNAANTFRVRDVTIMAVRTSGAGVYIGLETSNASAVVICRNSSISGPADISQTTGSIQLSNTTLQSNNANDFSFTSLDVGKIWQFCAIGASAAAATRYLRTCGAVATVEIPHKIPTACMIKYMHCYTRVVVAASTAIVFTLRRNGVNTPITVSIPVAATTASIGTLSTAFAAGDNLSIMVVTTGTTNTQDVIATLEYY